MTDLIEALKIFQKYFDGPYPTYCDHDVLYITCITREQVSDEDNAKLERLGFFWSGDVYQSFKFGSA